MEDVHAWLDSLGLAKYFDAFEANDLEWDLIPELDQDTLKDIGVVSAGHRLRILKAARTLSAGAETTEADSGYRTVAGATDSDDAQRRQLTVMFTDLVGSTELSTRLDPEELRDINRAYQDAVTGCIERFGGYVARYMGDGVLAYFGYPIANEDDAERAVRAALEITHVVPALKTQVALAVRVGIATGPVVVGDLIGEGAAQERAVVGETPNLAARLEGIAGSNQVVISAATSQLITGRFDLESMGQVALKGLDSPGPLYRVTGIRQGSRFDAGRMRELIPLVGRAEELGVLRRRWQLCATQEGQVAVLIGESGIGKSRLATSFLASASPAPSQTVDLHCSPFAATDALHPLIEYLARTIGVSADTNIQETQSLVGTWLGESAGRVELAETILARWLSRDDGALDLPTEVTPQVQKARVLAVVLENILRFAREAPVTVLVEDAQWADPSTWEFLEALCDASVDAAVFLILTMRPSVDIPWQQRGNVTHLSLNRLGRHDTQEVISHLLGGGPVPRGLTDFVLKRTDGAPLFVEALVRNLIETGVLRDGDISLESLNDVTAVPTTLQDSLMARLDRLGAAKEVAQIGAVLGTEFSHELLTRVSGSSASDTDEQLAVLVDAQVLTRRGLSSDSVYVFTQSLLREAAYSSLLMSRRRRLHGRIAKALLAASPVMNSDHYQLLSHHHELAGETAEAIRCACVAAERQADEHAIEEAIRIYLRVLSLVDAADEMPADIELTSILHRLSELRFTQGRFADAAAFAAKMRDAAKAAGNADAEATALLDMATAVMWQEDFETALAHADQALRIADDAGSVSAAIGAATLTGYIHGVSGRLVASQASLARGAELARNNGDTRYVPQIAFMDACIQNWTGNYDEAISIADRGRTSASEQGQVAHYLRCHWARATARVGKGDLDGAYVDLGAGLEMALKMGDQSYIPRYLNTLGWLFDECHAYDEAVSHCERAVEFDRGSVVATGVERLAFAKANWADALLGTGDLQGAKEMLESVHGIVANPRTHEWMRWRYSTHVFASMGQYLIAAGQPKAAEPWIAKCLAAADEKKSWKYVSFARRLSGLVHLHAKRWEAAEQAFDEARTIVLRIGYSNGLWRVDLDHASLMAARGDDRGAEDLRARATAQLRSAKSQIHDEGLARVFGTSGEAVALLSA